MNVLLIGSVSPSLEACLEFISGEARGSKSTYTINTQAYKGLKALIGLVLIFCFFSCKNTPNSTTASIPNSDTVNTNTINKEILTDSLTLVPAKGLVFYQGKPFSGTAITYNEIGTIVVSTDYLNGKKHGWYKKWFDDGMLSFEANYRDGKRHGITKSWWKNGNIRSESKFEDGIAEGVQMQWYKSGAKFKRINLKDGKEEGLQQSWRENGKLYNNYEAKNGRIFGLKRANLCYELEKEVVQYEGR